MTAKRAMRVVRWTLAGLVALVAAAVAILLTTDFGAWKGEAERAVQFATGRRLTIAGPVRLALLPVPSLVAEKVRFANAPWGSRPDMVRVDRVELRVALMPLFSGEVVVRRLVIDSPDILIETDRKGRGNWQMAALAKAKNKPGTGAPALPVIDNVTVTNARIAYRDAAAGTTDTLTLDRLTIRGADGGPPLDVSVAGALNGRSLSLAGLVAPAKGKAWRVSGLRASYAGISLDGTVTARPDATPPHVAATLHTPVIDFAALAPPGPKRPAAAGKTAPAKAATAGGKTGGKADGKMGAVRVIPAAPIPLEALRTVNADLSLSADRINAGPLVFTRNTVGLTVKGGTLTIHPFTATLAGGGIEGRAVLDGSGRLALRLAARDIDSNRLLTALGAPDMLTGPASLTVDLKGRGRTVRALLAGAEGTAALVLGKGTVGSGYVDLLGADLLRTLLPDGEKKDTTQLNCFAAPFVVQRGVAHTDAILFDTARMIVRGGGRLNLRDETLGFLLKPEPKDASLLSLATPIRVDGTLAAPNAYPDPEGLAKGVAGAVVGVALGPIGLLLPLVSGGAKEKNLCVAALMKQDGKAAPASARKEQEAKKEEESSGPAGVLEEVGSAIEKGFRSLFGQ